VPVSTMRWLTCVLVVFLALQLVQAETPQANLAEPLFQMQANMRARMMAAQAELENEANSAVDDMAAAASAEEEHHSIRSLIATEAQANQEQQLEAAPTAGKAKGTGANKPKAKASGKQKGKGKGKAKASSTKKSTKSTTKKTTTKKAKKHAKKTAVTKKAVPKPNAKVAAPTNSTGIIKPPQGPKFNFTHVIERLNGTVTILQAKLKAKTKAHDALKLKLATKAATAPAPASSTLGSPTTTTGSTSAVDTQSITLSYYVFGLIVAGSAVFGSILSFVLVKMCSSSNKSEYD